MMLTLICLAISWAEASAGQEQEIPGGKRHARQTIYGNIPYSEPYYASSLSEAFSTFRDPFIGGPMIPDFDLLGKSSDGNPKVRCVTEQCRGCSRIALEKILAVAKDESTKKEAQFLWKSLGLDDTTHDWKCDTSLKPEKPATCVSKVPEKGELLRFIRSLENPAGETCTRDSRKVQPARFSRAPPDQRPLYDYALMSCKIRGTPMEQDYHYMRVCGVCHGLMLLKEPYYPKVVHSFRCKRENIRCLSGHGRCRQAKLEVNIFKERENGTYKDVRLEVDTACEPYLNAGSVLRETIHTEHISPIIIFQRNHNH